jgi:glycosyltransferase involved in cell wall biosynthesis
MALMRVLYFVERFWPYIGGVEVMSARVMPELVKRGFELTVVTTSDGDKLPARDSYLGLDLRRLPLDDAIRSGDIERIVGVRRRFAALKAEVQPDLVHCAFTGATIYFPVMTAGVARAPMLLSSHGSWPPVRMAPNGLLQKAIDVAEWWTACSQAALDDLTAVDPSVSSRSQTIYNGLDPPPGEPTPLPLDPPVLLCAARIEPEKGLDLALSALALLREEFPRLRLRIVGHGSAADDLVAQAAHEGVLDSVELLGWRSPEQMAGLVDEATILLSPSRREGFGLIALEGMLGARPVIATRIGGLPEVLGEDGGILVEPESPPALAAAVAGLLRDPARAHDLGLAGRRRAQAVFPLRRCVDAYEDLYRTLANGHAP